MANTESAEESVTFSVVVPRELAERLTRLAEARGAKRSQFARVLLAEGAARHERIQRVAEALDQEAVAV